MERRLLGISIATVGTSECLVSQARKADLSHDGRVKMLPARRAIRFGVFNLLELVVGRMLQQSGSRYWVVKWL
jgi:hypothetical protein